MNRLQVATAIRDYLIERYALGGFPELGIEPEPEINLPSIWNVERSDESGWDWARGCYNVIWEGGYEWPYALTDAVYLGKLELPGIFLEPATGYAISIYLDR